MTTTNIIHRADLSLLIPEPIQAEIINGVAEDSACLRLMRRLPNMTSGTQRMPIISALPSAAFVAEVTTKLTGMKQTTEASWTYKTITAEEIACIIPIPEATLADSNYDVWAELRPKIVEAFGVVVDAAVIVGTSKPASWPDDFITDMGTAANTVALGTGGVDFVDDINAAMALVEADGYNVTGFLAPIATKAKLRGLRNAQGDLIFQPSLLVGTPDMLYGLPIMYSRNASFSTSNAHLIAGDFSQCVYSIRQDMTFKVLTEASIFDSSGLLEFSLAQQDLVALRVVMRLGWECPNPINRLQPTAANRYPLAAIIP